LTTNYYDDYTFDGGTTASLQAVGITKSTKTKTLLTGTKVYKDDGTAPLLTIHYYDDRARLIQSASQNHLRGTDYVTNTYNFVGELLTSKREHKASSSGAVTTLLTSNTYDHVGSLKDVKHKVNTQTEVIIARNEYNEIGQLKTKKQHSENGGTNFINTITYSYNERGWTTRASNEIIKSLSPVTVKDYFVYKLNYHSNQDNNTVLAHAQYNGNISQQLWGHGVATTPNTFDYSYDKLNRLNKGESKTGSIMYERLQYDDRGNITKLVRNNASLADTVATSYTYENSNLSNRLKSITKGTVTNNYTYDANGNAKTDRTGMTFRYNHLNLPDSVWNSTVKVGYLYDANGTNLRKYKSNAVDRDYVGGIEYASGNIEMIHTSEGYLQRSGTNYIYHYNLTDHLGNVRATLKPTSATTGEIIQKHDYYPFGKSKALQLSGINKYLYNGKEVQSELGDQQDYGARFYDPVIGRWNVVDPLAKKYPSISPYAYVANNPINSIDPDGREIIFRYSTKNGNQNLRYKNGEFYLHNGKNMILKVV
jgi:RHS repeat-associated protein